MDILLPSFGHTTTNVSPAKRWYSRISVPSILRSSAAMIVCSSTSASPHRSHQRCQRCHHDRNSPPINRHIPSNVSSAERWYSQSFVLYLPSPVAMIMIVIFCVSTINIGLTAATNDATIILPSIGTYHRMYHRPNDSIL